MFQTKFDFTTNKKRYVWKTVLPVLLIPFGTGLFVYCLTGLLNTALYAIGISGTLSLLVFLLPFILIYYNHSKHNRYSIFHIINQGKEGIYNYTDNNIEITFTDDDIEKTEVVYSTQAYRKRSKQLPWSEIFYTVFTLKNGKQIIISSFTFSDIDFLQSTTVCFPKTGFTRSWPLIKIHKTIPLIKEKHSCSGKTLP
ncbi:hypothetical protein Q763_07600 [Flavobacterium beibuense F44-8]|uniref:PH domain-containing protein n=1 Tax=Flavobacterium beibuense F44-8 TaxID=1406840 RepID=A0A0A2LQJ2_9FLAO|nr:hypothetical protein [Flavobacterium beibuense]KGO81503.1 hypothetical protein Q763_07600 [Flavobacterium beibuense F44-8]